MATSKLKRSEAEARWTKYYLAVIKEGRQVMYEVTKALYIGQNLRPDEYLKKCCKYTEDDYNDAFLPEQRQVISSWPNSTPYDIGKAALDDRWDILLHYQLQERACNLAQDSTGHSAKRNHSLKRLLVRLKKFRNDVSHEIPKLSQDQLNNKTKTLENLYVQILTTVGKIKGTSYDKEIREIQDTLLQRLSLDTSAPRELVVNVIHTKREDSAEDILGKVKLELVKVYDHKRSLNPGGIKLCKPVNISDLYSIPYVKMGEKNTEKRIRANKLLKLASSEKSETNLVIVGASGSGKTALMLYIMDQWCSQSSEMAGMDEVDLLFYVDLGSLRATSLASLIKDFLLKETCSHMSTDKVIQKLQQWRTFWLLDAFDESSPTGRKIVEEICLKFSFVFITIRPEFSSLLETSEKKRIFLELSGIDFDSARDISQEICKHMCSKKGSKALVEKFMKFMSEVGGMERGLINSPLQVTRLCLLWLESHCKYESIETSMQLYMGLLAVTLHKIIQRLVIKTGEIKINLEQKILKLIDVLSQIAWELVNENSTVLSDEQVTLLFDKCKKLNLFDYRVMIFSSFLSAMNYCENEGVCRKLSCKFFEKKDVDFFAARHMYARMKKERTFALYKVIENDKRWSDVVVNLVGIVTLESALCPSLAKQIVDYVRGMGYRTSDWLHLLDESMGNVHLVEEMSCILGSSWKMNLNGDGLMNNWKTLSSLVRSWRLQMLQIQFDSKPDNLKGALSRIEILGSNVDKMAVLCNWSLYDYSCNDVVDDFLRQLSTIPCSVTEFAGYLSAHAIMKLLPITVTKLTLRLRTHQQANALQNWLKRHLIEDLALILDFPKSLNLSFLPQLTPHCGIKVTIPKCDDIQGWWVAKVLRKLYNGRYSLIVFDTIPNQRKLESEWITEATSRLRKEFVKSLAEIDKDGIWKSLQVEKYVTDEKSWKKSLNKCVTKKFLMDKHKPEDQSFSFFTLFVLLCLMFFYFCC